MIPEKSDKIHVGLIIAFSSSNMDLCKYQNSPHALCLLFHDLLLLLSPLLPDRTVIYTAQSSDSFSFLYETVFIPWDIWTENQRLRVRTHESYVPSVLPALQGCLCSQRSLNNFQLCYSDFCRVSSSGSLNPPSTCLEMVTSFVSLDPGCLFIT